MIEAESEAGSIQPLPWLQAKSEVTTSTSFGGKSKLAGSGWWQRAGWRVIFFCPQQAARTATARTPNLFSHNHSNALQANKRAEAEEVGRS